MKWMETNANQISYLSTSIFYRLHYLAAVYGITGWGVKLLDLKACHFGSPSCTKEVRALGLVAQHRLRIFVHWVVG